MLDLSLYVSMSLRPYINEISPEVTDFDSNQGEERPRSCYSMINLYFD